MPPPQWALKAGHERTSGLRMLTVNGRGCLVKNVLIALTRTGASGQLLIAV